MPVNLPPEITEDKKNDPWRAPPPVGGGDHGPGGGFTGSFGGGGSGFYNQQAPGAFGETDPLAKVRRKLLQMAQGGVNVTYSPMTAPAPTKPMTGGTDTVPAMLTPGEGVLNTGAMAQPGVPQLMDLLNKMGMVQHFAWGGMVGPWHKSGWGSGMGSGTSTFAPGTSGGAPSGLGVIGSGGLFGDRNKGPVGAPAETPPISMGGNPWFDAGRNPAGSPAGQQFGDILSQFLGSGAFSPTGNQALMDALMGQARQTAQAQNIASQNAAKLYGLDPGQAGSFAMQQQLAGQSNVANALNNAQTQQLMNQQKFGQDQLTALQNFLYNYWQSQQDFEHGSGRPGGIGG